MHQNLYPCWRPSVWFKDVFTCTVCILYHDVACIYAKCYAAYEFLCIQVNKSFFSILHSWILLGIIVSHAVRFICKLNFLQKLLNDCFSCFYLFYTIKIVECTNCLWGILCLSWRILQNLFLHPYIKMLDSYLIYAKAKNMYINSAI